MRFMDISCKDLPSYEIGMKKGFERGIEKGIEKGKNDTLVQMATTVVEEFGLDPQKVAKRFGLSVETIKNFKEQK